MNAERYRRIYRAITRIPAGTVSSYGAIARLAGLPGRARLVGRALKEAPGELDLPWHRVVRADGRIAFPPGSPAFVEQCTLLQAEGVTVRNGRVDSRHRDPPDLDRLLWGPD